VDLVLWRHAEAAAGAPDLLRTLTPVGLKQAQRIAAWLAPRLPRDCRILVSPAERAQQTARALAQHFLVVDALAPGASAQALLSAVGWPDAEPALVVAHQPTLGEVASLLLAGPQGGWAIAAGALWWLDGDSGGAHVRLRAAIPPDLS
jgi:phosphohistidine phosphatase